MTVTMTAPEIGQSQKLTTTVALVVEYDGTNYFGFQWQANAPTIQGELEKALEKLTGEKVRVAASSRTDTGVHAGDRSSVSKQVLLSRWKRLFTD